MTSVIERLKYYIDSKKITIAAFERSVGMSNASLGKSLKNNGSIGSKKIEEILIVYPDINSEWLMTGKGPMLRREAVTYNVDPDGLSSMHEFGHKNEAAQTEVRYLKEQIKLKDEIIKDKEKIIELLSYQLSAQSNEPEYVVKSIHQGKPGE